jgi:hypothetical protein
MNRQAAAQDVLRKYTDDAERVADMLLNAKKDHRLKIERNRQEMRLRIKQKLEEVIKKEEDDVANLKLKKKELELSDTVNLEKTAVFKDGVVSVDEKATVLTEALKPLAKSLDVFL